ncbi:MAG TPA: adenylate/guanylate cyclase domain-containing protein [Nitrososphaerales archaeon]|nr:adenylate/guanylate cyclase domain-containing protein [Nitrososphaerales archaeon]
MSQERRLAAIMFTDMVGYTTLGQRNESLSLSLVEDQRNMIRPILARHRGREVKTMGDAFLVEFPNALDAIRCAYDIQRAARELNISMPEDRKVHLRIGVHLGDVVELNGDISGDAVNIASRVEPLADDGGVCLTGEVYNQVNHKIDLQMENLGPKNLKNVLFPIEIYRISMPWNDSRILGSAGRRNRLAVLPFVSMSPDPNDEYFADGLTEELIGKISQIKGLEVIARTSVMSFKKKEKKISEIARELGVGTVVEGSVRKAGNRIRVTVQVIDASTEGHLFSSNYDSNLDDIFAVQSAVASKVAESIPGTIGRVMRHTNEEKETDDLASYTLFLQGMRLLYEDEEEPLRHSLKLLSEAVERDPNFARAWAGLAFCYSKLGDNGYIAWQEAIDKGRASATKSLELNPNLAEAHCTLYEIMFHADEKLDVRLAELHKALELNPNLADGHVAEIHESFAIGDIQMAVRAGEKALQLDPLSPNAVRLLGLCYFYAGMHDRLLDHWSRTLHLNRYGTYRAMFDYYVSRGDLKQAETILKEMERIGPALELTLLNRGYFAALNGDTNTAKEMIDKLDATHKEGWARSSSAGYIYLALGDLDKFFEYMFRAASDHTLQIGNLRFSPLLELARKDPRFPEIFKRMGLPYSKEY